MEETMKNNIKNVCQKKGGTTCCIPQCKSNSMKNPDISFYQFPQESSVKETWLNLLGVKKQPLKSHKVCLLHFPSGKKTNSLPTMRMSSRRQTKNSCEGRNSPCPKLKIVQVFNQLRKICKLMSFSPYTTQSQMNKPSYKKL